LVAGSFAVSPDGRYLAVGLFKSQCTFFCGVEIVDLTGEKPPRPLPFTVPPLWKEGLPQDGVWALAFSPDGRTLVAGLRGGSLYRWDLTQEKPQPLIWKAHADVIKRVGFTADGGAVWSVGEDGLVKSREPTTGKERARFLAGRKLRGA